MLIELIKLAVRNIGKRKKRAALTMLGVFIGISAVVALVSLGQGLQETVNAQFEKVGADKILVQAKEIGFGGENAPGELKEHELEVIGKVHGVEQASGMLFRAGNAQFNDIQRTVYLMSNPKKPEEVELTRAFHTWEVIEGRLLTHKDHEKVVLGYNLGNNKIFKQNPSVGDKIIVNNYRFEIVGILKKIGDPGMDGSVILPETDMRALLNEPFAFSMIVAQSAKGLNPEEVADRIEKAIRRDRHQKEGKEDFAVQTSTELIASFNTVLNIIQAVFVGIAAISLLVGGVGIMNTMYTAVLERTKEIGIMKAIGAQNKDVLVMFLLESGFLGITGGIIGVILGASISKLVEIIANASFGPGTLNASFPLLLIIGAVVFSFTVGAVSGVLPARRASKLKPVEALRYE